MRLEPAGLARGGEELLQAVPAELTAQHPEQQPGSDPHQFPASQVHLVFPIQLLEIRAGEDEVVPEEIVHIRTGQLGSHRKLRQPTGELGSLPAEVAQVIGPEGDRLAFPFCRAAMATIVILLSDGCSQPFR